MITIIRFLFRLRVAFFIIEKIAYIIRKLIIIEYKFIIIISDSIEITFIKIIIFKLSIYNKSNISRI